MLGAGMTQVATAEALGLSDRTLRNWLKLKSFQSAVERARARAEQQPEQAERSAARALAAFEREQARHSEPRRDPDQPSATEPVEQGISGNVAHGDELLRKAADDRAAKMRRAYCTEHQRAPEVRVVESGGEYLIEASFCCEPAKEGALRTAGSKKDAN
jgi:hypothetical protein